MFKKYLSYLFLFGLIACGGDSKNSDEFTRQEEQIPEPEVLQRVYRADFKPINPLVVKRAEGQVVIRIEDDSFEVNLAIQNVPSSIHRQYIFDAKNCPNSLADTNLDAYIDGNEALVVSGPAWLPLDGDLDNIGEDSRTYPNGGFLNAFVYREETSRSRLLSGLGPRARLEMDDRIVMIFGIDDNETLPTTVASPGGRPVQETLPIACAELVRVIGQ